MNDKIKYGLWAIGIIVFGFLIGYFLMTQFNQYEYKIEQMGYTQGVQDVTISLVNKLSTCQSIPATNGNNQTITIIAYECLEQK